MMPPNHTVGIKVSTSVRDWESKVSLSGIPEPFLYIELFVLDCCYRPFGFSCIF